MSENNSRIGSWFRFRGVSITREGTYYFLVFLFILAGAIVRSRIQLLMLLACMLLGPLLYNAWVVYRSMRYIKIIRRVPHLLSCGETFFVELTAKNSARHSTYAIVIEDQLVQTAGVDPEPPKKVEVFFAKVAKQGESTLTYKAVIRKRGKYQLGPLTASTAFPLGLMRNTRPDPVVSTVVVMPRLGSMTPAWRRMIQQEQSGFSSSRRQHGLLEGDFYGLREWRSGDPKQWIHWRSSAKQGELVVRQFEKQNQQDFVLLVDAWIPKEPTQEDKDRAERIISMAATAVRDLAGVGGCHLQMICCGAQLETIVGTVSQAYVVQAMHDLAVQVPTHKHPIGETLRDTLKTSKPGSRIVMLTTRDIDLSDTEVFSRIWNDPKLRTDLGRVRTISAGRDEDNQFFHLPKPKAVQLAEEES
ncbi:DUF58 domain-containing protein [Bremerella cremea]|uniref:DUF58 domain-containing protein n=1 Tax=Blastopirellula marina TaxID=124 RepID=A0A2S8FBY0_9BACT|nr:MULTISPECIES: DUF58 domain-containing protein [Pirellulaceae]PQO29676.1 hypothetical protein C5Y83_26875 [Blastopirellula marina]RCS42978.1 DUF58 domain-containing protein [Bremerella cremea]